MENWLTRTARRELVENQQQKEHGMTGEHNYHYQKTPIEHETPGSKRSGINMASEDVTVCFRSRGKGSQYISAATTGLLYLARRL